MKSKSEGHMVDNIHQALRGTALDNNIADIAAPTDISSVKSGVLSRSPA
jgi:hypothetical protein